MLTFKDPVYFSEKVFRNPCGIASFFFFLMNMCSWIWMHTEIYGDHTHQWKWLFLKKKAAVLLGITEVCHDYSLLNWYMYIYMLFMK